MVGCMLGLFSVHGVSGLWGSVLRRELVYLSGGLLAHHTMREYMYRARQLVMHNTPFALILWWVLTFGRDKTDGTPHS